MNLSMKWLSDYIKKGNPHKRILSWYDNEWL